LGDLDVPPLGDLGATAAATDLTATFAGEPPATVLGAMADSTALAGGEQAAETVQFAAGEAGTEEVEAAKEAEEGQGQRAESKMARLLGRLAEASPYTVLLGVALAALVLGVVFLILEWSRYGSTKAKLGSTLGPPAASQSAVITKATA
jgi:hypothetical protein